jgi:hypothetical protein
MSVLHSIDGEATRAHLITEDGLEGVQGRLAEARDALAAGDTESAAEWLDRASSYLNNL